MAHLKRIGLVAVAVAIIVSTAQAAYFWIDPTEGETLVASAGDIITYDLYFHTDVDNEYYVAGWELYFNYDKSELSYITPSLDPPVFGMIEGFMDPVVDTVYTYNDIRASALLGTGYESTGPAGDLLMGRFEFEVINPIYDGGLSDFVLLEQVGSTGGGIAHWSPDRDVLSQFDGAEGANVVIPEPATTALIGLGALGVLLRKKS